MSINAFPAAISAIIQNGILVRVFEEALKPNLVYRQMATLRPFESNVGETKIFTRTGLLTPKLTPLTPGQDPTASTYSVEQYTMTLNQYGDAMDTNMLTSATALASKFLEDNQKLAFGAAQTLNQLARNEIYGAYKSGNTRAVGAQGTSSATMTVNDVTGFTTQIVNGVQTAVSAGNPLVITIDGVANTVIGYDTGNKTLTLGTATTWADGAQVLAANAPKIFRPNARTTSQKLVAADTASLSVFMDAVAYLRTGNVPTLGGYYPAFIDPTTERQLFADADFKQALQGRVDSPIWQGLSIGRFAGIDWIRTTEAPTVAGAGGVTVHEPIVCGADALIEGPMQGFGDLLSETGVQIPGVVTMVNGIKMIHRPPLDRLQQNISSAWSWVGDFAVPTDATTGAAAQFKRAAVVEHAG